MWEVIETLIGLFVIVLVVGGLLCLNGFLNCWDKADRKEMQKHQQWWKYQNQPHIRNKPKPPWDKYLPWWLKF